MLKARFRDFVGSSAYKVRCGGQFLVFAESMTGPDVVVHSTTLTGSDRSQRNALAAYYANFKSRCGYSLNL